MLGLTAIEPQLGFNWALPCQLTLQGGEGVLERLADKPSLPIGDRVEGLDGLWFRPGVKLHRPASAMDPRRAPRQGRNDGGRNRLPSRLLHVADEPDGLHGFGRVEQASLRRDDDEISPADRVADHQGRGSLEIDDDEGGLEGGPVDLIQDRIFRHVSDDGQLGRPDGLRVGACS